MVSAIGLGRWAYVHACLFTVALPLALGAQLAATQRASADVTRSVRATRLREGSIAIDGRLDDAVWRETSAQTRFIERYPDEGRPAPVTTALRVAYDLDALYVAVDCGGRPGEVPRARALRRDETRIGDDDAVVVKLDVRRDRRTTMAFVVNVAGAQADYLATENGASQRYEVDALWDAAATPSAGGWTVEMRIPFAAMGLAPEDGERALGLNVTRLHAARGASYDWAPMPRATGGLAAEHYGELRGLRGVGGARAITLAPHVRASWSDRRPGTPERASALVGDGDPWSLTAGVDASVRLADDTWAQATVLSDFSDAELDASVVNLGRFPLFRPERRTFFLTGLEILELGSEGQAQPFFSRRIGLDDDGRPITVLGGAKLYGRAGPLSFGLLAASTIDPIEHFAVARGRVELTDGLRLGALGVTRLSAEHASPHVAAGADVAVDAVESRLSIRGYAIATHPADASNRDGWAAGLTTRYRGALSPSLAVDWVDPHFDPQVGFVRRTGAMRAQASLPWALTPAGGPLEALTLSASGSLETSHTLGRELGRTGGVELEVLSRAGVAAGAYLGGEEETIDEPFEPLPGVAVEPGTYGGLRAAVGVGLASRLDVSGQLVYELSTAFYGGSLHTLRTDLSVALGSHVRASAVGTLGYAVLPQRDGTITWTADGTLSLVPSTVVSTDVVLRANGLDRTAVGMLRVRWQWAAGSDLVAVYRVGAAWDGEHAVERALTLSWTYRLDVPT